MYVAFFVGRIFCIFYVFFRNLWTLSPDYCYNSYYKELRGFIMSEFSDLFSKFINEKNIKVYSLVKYCQLDRSTMYKLISGKRNPPSEEIFQRISDFMHLTPLEYAAFREAYYITVIGRENYFCQKNVEDFIMSFPDCSPFHVKSLPASLKLQFETPRTQTEIPACTALTNRLEVEQSIHHILMKEASEKDGKIALILQPDNDFLFSLLSSLIGSDSSLQIEHMICLNKSKQIDEHNQMYNLIYLKKILPLYIHGLDYHPYYFCDDIHSHHRNFNGFSYLIVTSNYAVTCTSDYTNGILYHDRGVVQMLRRIYDSYQRRCAPLFYRASSLMEESRVLGDIGWESSLTYTIQPEPCLIPFITPGIMEDAIAADLPGRETLMELWFGYIASAQKRADDPCLHIYYTVKGLRQFAATGRLSEIPESIYRALTIHERLFLLKKLFAHCSVNPWRLMKEPLTRISDNFHLCVSDSSGYLLFNNTRGQQVYLIIKEPVLLSAFLNYAENLSDNRLYTAQETAAFIKEIIDELERAL